MAGVHQMLLGSGASYVFKETISANTQNYNLKARALAAGWDGLTPLDAQVSVASGVVIGATSTSAYAFDTGTGFSAGTKVALINDGMIIGMFGNGGYGASVGSPGGPALRAQVPISITNTGIIGGGGGGGGGKQVSGFDENFGSWNYYLVGGHGAGGGTAYSANTGGSSVTEPPGGHHTAGSGGALGASGTKPSSGGYNGGAGGVCTSGNANITWFATGARYGALG